LTSYPLTSLYYTPGMAQSKVLMENLVAR